MACTKAKGTSVPTTAAVCSSSLVLRQQPVDAGGQHCLRRGRHLHGQCRPQAVSSGLASQHPGFHQGAHALLQEEGVALGAGDHKRREASRLGSYPSSACKNSAAQAGSKGIKPRLRVVRLAAPAVLVLRPIGDQQQGRAVGGLSTGAVEQGLGLGIDPVQVLTHQQYRVHLAGAQQHALEPLQGVLAALEGVEV